MPESKWERFLQSRKSKYTRKTYSWAISQVTDDPDAFLAKAAKKGEAAENQIIDWVLSKRTEEDKWTISSATIATVISAFQSFTEWSGVHLNWKRIRSTAPTRTTVANDRTPTREEMHKLLEVAGTREKLMTYFMISGCKLGVLPALKVRDVKKLPSGILQIKAYEGYPEEYVAFASQEAADAYETYMAERRSVGEKITEDSPVIRDKWDWQYKNVSKGKRKPAEARPMLMESLSKTMIRLWQRAGVKVPHGKREFKADHGLRKFFETNFNGRGCPEGPAHAALDKKCLMGSQYSYHKPTPEHLEQVYLGTVDNLYLNEKYQLRQAIKVQEQEHSAKWQENRLELLESRDRIRELEKKLKDLETKPGLTREEVRKMFEDEFQRMSRKAGS